jgi:hypothetical protein
MTRVLRAALAVASVALIVVSVASLVPFLGRSAPVWAQGFVAPTFGGLCGFGGFGFGGCTFGGGFGVSGIGGGGIGGFGGSFGSFVLVTPAPTVVVGESVPLLFAWIVPSPGTWRDIDSLEVRLRNGGEIVLWLQWEETTNTLALIDPDTEEIHGVKRHAGSGGNLNTKFARVDLANSAVEDSGPGGESVALLLSLSFKPSAAGHMYEVEVAGTDDQGQVLGFGTIGTIDVHHKHR